MKSNIWSVRNSGLPPLALLCKYGDSYSQIEKTSASMERVKDPQTFLFLEIVPSNQPQSSLCLCEKGAHQMMSSCAWEKKKTHEQILPTSRHQLIS